MFGKENNFEQSKEIETVIGASVKVEGDFVSAGNIIIRGIINGSIKTQKNLSIEEKAVVNANIEAESIKIAGAVKGDALAKNEISILSKAQIKGNIITNSLSIEKGAIINGNVTMGQTEKTKLEDKDKNKSIK